MSMFFVLPKKHLLTLLPTCVPTCVRASIRAFNCSSISGNLENWANFCSDSSNFSCIAAIFSSWSYFKKNVYYLRRIKKRKKEFHLVCIIPSVVPLYAAILVLVFHLSRAMTLTLAVRANSVFPALLSALLGLLFEQHFRADLAAISHNVPELYRIPFDASTDCPLVRCFYCSGRKHAVAIVIIRQSIYNGKLFINCGYRYILSLLELKSGFSFI